MGTTMGNPDKSMMCRLCMKNEDVILMDIFDEDVNGSNEAAQIPMLLKIMACVDIEVDVDDSISHYVCHRCAHKVNLFYDFKERCKQVDVVLREKMRKQFVNVHFQEDTSYGDDSEEIQTEDEPTVLLVPISSSSKHDNLKDPLAFSDSETNALSIFERKPVHLLQEKRTMVKIDEVIRQQRENFNRIRQTQKRRAEFLDLENTIKQQRETFKSKDLKDNSSPEVVKEPIKATNEPAKVIKEPVKATNEPAKVTKEPVKAASRKTYCRLCHRSIPSEQFSKHSLSHQKKKQFSTSDQKKNTLKYKRITHAGKKMYCCVICAKIFIMKYSLQRHLLLHQAKDILKTKKVHQCPVCNKCYTVSSSLKRHLILHTGERPFKCPICPRTFCDRSNLIKHERIHYPVKPFSCTLCPAKFQFKNYLRKHLAQHLDDRRMSVAPDHDCYTKKLRPDEQLAMLMSTNKAWLGKHLLRFSADTSSDEDMSDTDNDIEVIPINTDDAVPSTSQQQQEILPEEDDQVEMERNAVSSWFRCRNCQTICPTYEQLVEHRKIHSGVAGFRCTICKLLFQSQSALTRHSATSHFKCSNCDKVFVSKLMCQRHEKEHKFPNKNSCSLCDRAFITIDALSKHMMKHNKQAPFKCALCNSVFSSRAVLDMHFKVCRRQMKQQPDSIKE